MSLSRLASQQVQRDGGGVGVQAAPVAQPDGDDRFDLLTKYIPTETITLFVAAMAAQKPLAASIPGVNPTTLYVAGAVLTPVALLVATLGKQRLAGVKGTLHPWPFIASLIAYLIWALSVPGMVSGDDGRLAAAFGALLVATVLSWGDALFAPVGAGEADPDSDEGRLALEVPVAI